MEIESRARTARRARVSPRTAAISSQPRITSWEWIIAGTAVVALCLTLRAQANMAPCAFLPLLVASVILMISGDERARAKWIARRLWASLDSYARGSGVPWAAVGTFVVIPAALLNLSNDHIEPIGDTSCVVPSAVSLLREGNTDLDEYARAGLWWSKPPDPRLLNTTSSFVRWHEQHWYPAHPSGMVPLTLPVVALARLAGAKVDNPIVQLRLEKLTAALVGAVALGVFFLLALHLVPPAPAWATTALLATASGMLTTVGQNLWQHDGIILGSLTLLLLEFHHPARRATGAQGFICGFMLAFRLTAVTFLLPFGIWILWRAPRRALLIACLAALAFAPWAVYYLTVSGTPFGPSSTHMNITNWSATAVLGRLASVLVSPGRGLLTYQPWILLAATPFLPAVRRTLQRQNLNPGPNGWMRVCIAATVLEVLVVSAWHCWWGGYCWGSRLVVSVVPLCALLCARPIAGLLTTLPGRSTLAALLLLGLLVQAPGAYTDAFRWNFAHAVNPEQALWSWTDAPFLAPLNLPRK